MQGKLINTQQLVSGLNELKHNAMYSIHKLMVDNKIEEIDLKPSNLCVAGQVGNRAFSERWELTKVKAFRERVLFTAQKNGIKTNSVFLDCYDLQFILEFVQMSVKMHKDCLNVK